MNIIAAANGQKMLSEIQKFKTTRNQRRFKMILLKALFRKMTQDEIMIKKIDKELFKQIKYKEEIESKIKELKFELIIADKLIEANKQILLLMREI
jgi:hypothetical protein